MYTARVFSAEYRNRI